MVNEFSVRPTGKFSEKVENLKRWARFPGWNFRTEFRVLFTRFSWFVPVPGPRQENLSRPVSKSKWLPSSSCINARFVFLQALQRRHFCTIGSPMTMLAMKSLWELLAIGVRSLVIKTETILLNRTEPRHVKLNTICVSGYIIVFQHVMLASLSTSFTANWSFLESFYAWFITLSTIGFGDVEKCRNCFLYYIWFSFPCHMWWASVSVRVFYRSW